uniref:ATPase n=1 Tax=candidate division WOR-3 bacterium TaxID=2052148 RepID=A0A7V3ZYG0_UNCW3
MSRKDKMLDAKIHDPYMDKNIYKDPTICPTCGLVYHNKMWKRDAELAKQLVSTKEVEYKDCPACRKVKDNYPLGVFVIKGEVVNDEKRIAEIQNLIKHEVEKESVSNPLARIMKIEKFDDRIEISTTTEGLATRIGKAVSRAYQGELEFIFSESDKFLRVIWHKD